MIKADIPQDVTEYKEQFFFGLTIRQFVCGIAMIALAILTFLIGKNFISTDILMYIVIMRQPIPWADGLILNADGFVGDYYKKD